MLTSQSHGVSSPKSEVTALVVDDDKVSQMIHHQLLNILGIENDVVVDGKQAVDIHLSGKKFDLILMDRDMPVMNGIEATKKLRDMGIRSTIAGVSSHSSSKEKQEFIEAGLDVYHEKPLSAAKLLSVVSKMKHTA
ncbi:two-component response regulator 24-like [Rhodamnia argentea]|uniref:Two-component response regulator 24-like n=1 Tax=Rhodamnia argentea TaxID=178133 RepID=A0A8B8QT42_9MYRT|nr:two-component response regulator 24-like [Rhodamnia argentea]